MQPNASHWAACERPGVVDPQLDAGAFASAVTRARTISAIGQAPARPNTSGAKIRQQAACAIGAASVDCPQGDR